MENTRKNELLQYIEYLQPDHLLGVYYLDKILGITHYSIYTKEDLHVLEEKLKGFDAQLENDLAKILLWKSNISKDYLVGVYDGIVNNKENELDIGGK